MSDAKVTPFDDPAGRTRFAWARTLLVALAVSLLIERLFFGSDLWFFIAIAIPLVVMGVIALRRSLFLRSTTEQNPQRGLTGAQVGVALGSTLFIAAAGLIGVIGGIAA
jgi:hypothetical protein